MTEYCNTTIAIVGGGPACVAFLDTFVAEVDAERARVTHLLVYEPNEVGPGLAYQADVCSLVLNREADAMAVEASDARGFCGWLKRNGLSTAIADPYPSRHLFGRYLVDRFAHLCRMAAAKGLRITVIHEYVTHIVVDNDRYYLGRASGGDHADIVILAAGHTQPRDYYGLWGHDRYFHHPYPLKNKLPQMLKAELIGVIGTGLTAVDVALGLFDAGFEGRIVMMSSRACLPFVRGQTGSRHHLRYLTRDAIAQLRSDGATSFSLRSVFRLLRRELRSVWVDWRSLFGVMPAAKVFLDNELEDASMIRAWQQVLAATNDVVEDVWRGLDDASRRIVLTRFAQPWGACRAPMPRKNALKLAAKFKENKLAVFQGPSQCRATPSGAIHVNVEGTSRPFECDYIVNATGPARQIESPQDFPLLWQMQEVGLVKFDAFGGIAVEFMSGAVIDANGHTRLDLRAMGHVTQGTYFFVTSMEMIVKRARHMALQILASLPTATRQPYALVGEAR